MRFASENREPAFAPREVPAGRDARQLARDLLEMTQPEFSAERIRLTAEAEHAEALREAGQLKGAFLAVVSHDIRTPPSAIRALAHDLATGLDERALVYTAPGGAPRRRRHGVRPRHRA